MICEVKTEENQMSTPFIRSSSKKQRIGRWSPAECYLFQSLLEKYGKNWRQIQGHMKNRTLSQIRSHAQKYFDKIGPAKMYEFQRRAKLLQAYEILEKEKKLREETLMKDTLIPLKIEVDAKSEEESPITAEENLPVPAGEIKTEVQENKEESIIKEQYKGQEKKGLSSLQKMEFEMPNFGQNGFQPYNGGYLIQILNQNFQIFQKYQGIEPFIDNSAFRASVFRRDAQ